MEKLKLEHFEKQKNDDGTYPPILYFLVEDDINSDGEIPTYIESYNPSKNKLPDFEFVKFSSSNMVVPQVKRIKFE